MKCPMAMLLVAMLTGCATDDPAAKGTPPDRQAITAADLSAPQLAYSLSAEPGTLYKQEVPSSPTGPRTAIFTFIADNKTKHRFNGEAPTSAIVRIVVKNGEMIAWDGPEMVLQVITPVELPANSKSVYTVNWEIPDITKLPSGEYHVVGTFIPTGETAKTSITIKDKM